MRYGVLVAGALGLVLGWSGPAPAQGLQGKKEPLVERVKKAISKGVRYLRDSQRHPAGTWELVAVPGALQEGGQTSLVLLALLNSGARPDDPMIKSGLTYLRGLRSDRTYVVALQTMVFAEAGQVEDRERIQQNVKWLIDASIMRDGKLQGWTYTKGNVANADNSNTQYALLGLLAGKSAGVTVPREVWQSIRDYYTRTQQPDGGWTYDNGRGGGPFGNKSSLTMTTAGLSGLLIAGMELNAGRETIVPGGPATNCGVYDDAGPAAKALSWIRKPGFHDRFSLEVPNRTFYNLYGIERAGRLSGRRFFGEHDWYREGCQYLVEKQHGDGSWHTGGNYDQWEVISTSFALLFLSKGRTPVLVSKLVHGAAQRDEADTDWNNDRYDARNLTAFASRELFKKIPLAWQAFDILRAVDKDRGNSDEGVAEVTSDLLQSPIVYFNGHKSPRLRIGEVERDVLKKYVENGGFIIAEACCGSRAFDAGFRQLVQEMWPDNELVDLPAEHPIWRAHFPVPPGSFKLQGLNMGCKTVLVYSPEDMSCLWESNRFDQGQAQLAFRLGANIIAYATGMEPPRPRLSQTEVASTKEDVNTVPRGYLKAAQLKHTGDWQPAPRAMRNLMDHLNKTAGVDVALQTQPMEPLHENFYDFKFLYMHGRGDFNYGEEDAKKLRFHLRTGGLLLADACCGSSAFDQGFRRLVRQLFPNGKLEQVPATDVVFSKDLNGQALTDQNIRLRRERGGEFRNTAPLLEGVKFEGRWVILYSKYDLGCALERHQSSDCLGYDHASALRIGSAAVLYLLRP